MDLAEIENVGAKEETMEASIYSSCQKDGIPMVENQMEKNIANKTKTGDIYMAASRDKH